MVEAAASIPSKFKTIVLINNEKLAFNSGSKRFVGNNQSDGPSPVSYDITNTLTNQNNCSYSRKGFGGFASKVKRFTIQQSKLFSVGPGDYNLDQKVNFDYNRAPCTRNFHPPIVVHRNSKSMTPAPNQYDVCGKISPRISFSKNLAPCVGFMSQSKRDFMNVKTNKDFPAPGAYNISEELTSSRSRAVQAPFKSTLQRDMIIPKSILENPGPAAYHPYNIEPTYKPNFQHKRYFRIFYPVVQLPSKAATPGPGQYDIVKYEPLKLPKSSSMFVSSTNRCAKTAFNGPGPAEYDPHQLSRRSFFYNFQKKWI